MAQLVRASLTTDVLSIAQLIALVKDDSAGAIATFTGNVRNHDGGRQVTALRYEIHPTAHEQITVIANSVIESSEAIKVALSHRYGAIEIGESAFFVTVSAAHRASAFEICSRLVDQIKAKLPIWKYQVFVDGTGEWVNSA